MDLWEAILKAPIWLKFILGVIFFSSFWTAAKVLLPVPRGALVMLKAVWYWGYKREQDLIWLLQRPSIELVTTPTISTTEKGDGSTIWFAEFTFRVQSRDNSPAHVVVTNTVMTIDQGSRIRMSRVEMYLDQSSPEAQQQRYDLGAKGSPNSTLQITVRVREGMDSLGVREAPDLTKPYKWRIRGIEVKLKNIRLGKLPTLKGEHRPSSQG